MCDKRDMAYFEQSAQQAELGKIAAQAVDSRKCAGRYLSKYCWVGCSMADFCRARKEMAK